MPFDGSLSDVATTLRRALALFGPDGKNWIPYGYRWPQGWFCMVGALEEVMGLTYQETIKTPAYRALCEAAGVCVIARYNDTPGRTFAEVRSVFERAIARTT